MICRTAVFTSCLVLFGCSNADTAASPAVDGGPSDGASPCTAQQEAPCACDGGASGTKPCIDGSFGPCSCPGDLDSSEAGADVHGGGDASADAQDGGGGHDTLWCGGHHCVEYVFAAEALTCSLANGEEVCDYVACAQDFWDLDGDRTNGCEYSCIRASDSDATCDGFDDDCNGLMDDGIDFCSDGANCGRCGRSCENRPHAAASCSALGSATCDDSNTQCEIDSCAPGHFNANGFVSDGCELACVKTTRTVPTDPATLAFCDSITDPSCGAVEYEDDLDNDCNGYVDEGFDPDVDHCVPYYDESAFPGNRHACSRGVEDPTTGQVSCFSLGPASEVCDGTDNDCDGQVDESSAPPDGIIGTQFPGTTLHVGDSCGQSSGACEPGWLACIDAVPTCILGVGPSPERCDCIDNDCDGLVDEEGDPHDPPMCGEGKACVAWAWSCECAAPCEPGPRPCPTGFACEEPEVSGSGPPESAGARCVRSQP